jgi:ssDNA-binding Zn-finger/Zn-ribbon topoisomerase 1
MAGASSEFVEDYLKRGFSDIVVIDYSHEEERYGYNNETTTETVVAKKGDTFIQFNVSLYQKFNPHRPSRELTPGSEMRISEAEYRSKAEGKPILETKAVSEKLEASAELRQITPVCPHHNIQLIVRWNSKKKQNFWGCPRFPNCNITQNFTPKQLCLYTVVSRTTI